MSHLFGIEEKLGERSGVKVPTASKTFANEHVEEMP
jgi:hypothetical protein